MNPGMILRPFGPTMYKSKVSEEFRKHLIESAANEDAPEMNYTLAGNIDKEVTFDLPLSMESELQWFVNDYMEQMVKAGVHQPPKGHVVDRIVLDDPWINVQKKGEWNPPHIHAGDYSCIVYAQVPDELREEWTYDNQRGRNPTAGMVEWHYGQWAPGNISQFGPIPPEEGDIFLFPAWLVHYVYPFNADVERISFSTNFFVNYVPAED